MLRKTKLPGRSKPIQRKKPLLRRRKELLPEETKKPIRKEISKVSKNQAKKLRLYAIAKEDLFSSGDDCEVKIPGICICRPAAPHHKEGRVGKNIHDRKKLKRCCQPCHDFITEHSAWAIDNGHSLRRNGPLEKNLSDEVVSSGSNEVSSAINSEKLKKNSRKVVETLQDTHKKKSAGQGALSRSLPITTHKCLKNNDDYGEVI